MRIASVPSVPMRYPHAVFRATWPPGVCREGPGGAIGMAAITFDGALLIRNWLKRSRASSNGCAQVKISGYGLIPCCIILANPIREIEGGKEIQEGKARRPGAQEEGDEEGEAGQESKG